MREVGDGERVYLRGQQIRYAMHVQRWQLDYRESLPVLSKQYIKTPRYGYWYR